MPFDAANNDIERDFDILEAIGGHLDGLMEAVVRAGGPQKTVRRWLTGHADPPDDPESQITLFAMASDLELFTPSMSGKTAVDRYLSSRKPGTAEDRAAFDALGAAEFRLVRIVDRGGLNLVRLKDLVTEEELFLLHSLISPLAIGAATVMRLCPLASGHHVLISPLFVIDEAVLAAAMGFVRPGRPLGHGCRCAAGVYRDVARRGVVPMPTLAAQGGAQPLPDQPEVFEDLSEVQRLAIRWPMSDCDEDRADLTADIRQAACLDNLVDACGWFANARAERAEEVEQALEAIADLLMETVCERARAGVGGYADALDRAAAEIADHIAAGDVWVEAGALLERLRTRWALRTSGCDERVRNGNGSADGTDLDRVIQRILALRAKTVDRGCTQEEAMAAAAKVAELLDRYDLSLDEVGVRASNCAGAAVETSRRRRAPIDSCIQPVATFCDCRAWSEENDAGTLRYIFFGLRADVEAARFLHDLIETTLETETTAFRKGKIYKNQQGGDRRAALNSFQIGLASGIVHKLNALKSTRTATATTTTGFDLVAVKHSVVDDELERLGLRFTTKRASSRRLVHGDAFEAGRAVGASFDPHPSLDR
jgi:hypothetical protein